MGKWVPLLEDESIDDVMVGGEFVMTKLQHMYTKESRRIKPNNNEQQWVEVPLDTGSHDPATNRLGGISKK